MRGSLKKDGRELNVRVDGQLVFNTGSMILKAALEGRGLAYLPEGQLEPYIASGILFACLRIGVNLTLDIIFTIQATDNPHRHLGC
ncbi:LysR family transcriptional regulator [Klebsiella variicola]|nr:LysR family transcriptional regulator [Klebsiella variicola]